MLLRLAFIEFAFVESATPRSIWLRVRSDD